MNGEEDPVNLMNTEIMTESEPVSEAENDKSIPALFIVAIVVGILSVAASAGLIYYKLGKPVLH